MEGGGGGDPSDHIWKIPEVAGTSFKQYASGKWKKKRKKKKLKKNQEVFKTEEDKKNNNNTKKMLK